MNNLSSLIKFHRRAAELSQAELASLAGVSRKVVQNLEMGNTKVSWDNVIAVLYTLNVSLEPSGPIVPRWRSSLDAEQSPAQPPNSQS